MKIVTKASGINSSWKILYDEELTANAKSFTVDNIPGNQLGVIKIVLSAVMAGTGGIALVVNDDRTVANYKYVNLKCAGSSATVVSDTTTLPEIPLATKGDLYLSGYPVLSEIMINTTSAISANRLIKVDTAVLVAGVPNMIQNSCSWEVSDEVTKILIGGDETYGESGLDLFLFGVGTRLQVLGMNK